MSAGNGPHGNTSYINFVSNSRDSFYIFMHTQCIKIIFLSSQIMCLEMGEYAHDGLLWSVEVINLNIRIGDFD